MDTFYDTMVLLNHSLNLKRPQYIATSQT